MASRSDTFNRADNTTSAGGSISALGTPSDGGSEWIVVSSGEKWGIVSNAAYEPGGNGQSVTALESSASDVEVQFTIATVGSDAGIVARLVDSDNYLLVTASASGATMYKRVSGSFTAIGTPYATAIANGDVLKFVVNGSSLEFFVNGLSRITATDGALSTATKHGMRSNNNTSARFDDFSITDLAGGGGSSSGAAAHYYRQMQ